MNNEYLESLSENEKQEVYRILKEMAEQGSSSSLSSMLNRDWKEEPVDIETFLKSPDYLGKAYMKDGVWEFYPAWLEILKDIFPNNYTTKYNEVLLSGATGIGKSNTANICILYMLHRLMCLRNPLTYLNLMATDKITFTLLNITLEQSEKVAYQKFIDAIRLSPWFLNRGIVSGTKKFRYEPNGGNISIEIASTAEHALGKAIFVAFLDEASFKKGHSVKLQENAMMNIYNTINERMKSRYVRSGGFNPCLMIMASSKRAESSFMEQYVSELQKQNRPEVLVIDRPRWEIKPSHNYSGKKFKVAVGNKYLASYIIPDGADVETYQAQGHTIIEVPVEEKTSFIQDIDTALMNVAGISSLNVMKFFSGAYIQKCYDSDLKNPFNKEVYTIGDGEEDTSQIKDFFDEKAISEELTSKPIFIHLDLSGTLKMSTDESDDTGICAIAIEGAGKNTIQYEDRDNEPELYYKELFNIGITKPKGGRLSLEKNRQFIYYLRSLGWNIKGVSCDSYQSLDTLQILERKGFITSNISLDRSPQGYHTLKNILIEKRISLLELPELEAELIGLERDNITGKIDHIKGAAKDRSDALAGALYNASLYKSEYLFHHGEDLENLLDINKSSDESGYNKADLTQQIKEQGLKRIQNDKSVNNIKDDKKQVMVELPKVDTQNAITLMEVTNKPNIMDSRTLIDSTWNANDIANAKNNSWIMDDDIVII